MTTERIGHRRERGIVNHEPSCPTWIQLTTAEVTGRLGLAKNEYGTTVTVFICESCLLIFAVTGDVDPETFGNACLGLDCDSYDIDRDVDLMFEIEPWRIVRGDTP